MQERERILELVKKGVLSTEEALILLENIAQKNDERQIKQVADKVNKEKLEPQVEPEEAVETAEEIEARLAQAVEKMNEASAKLDQVNEKLKGVTDNLAELESQKQIYDTMAELGRIK